MAHYAIGDIQGCFTALQTLLSHIGFNPGTDTLWLTGDIVNRGPQSLATLRFIKQHESSIQTVLGNHDLHLIALSYGYGRLKKNDTIHDVLNAPDRLALIDWLRAQPLLIHNHSHILVHAGLWPHWDLATAQNLSAEVETAIRAPNPSAFFAQMYGNTPVRYHPEQRGIDRLRFSTNVFTRLRAITLAGDMDFNFKSTLADMPPHLCAWFDAPHRQHRSHTVVFGHWSALGLYQHKNTLGLDTGALWGGPLTAADLNHGQIYQVANPDTLNWKKQTK